MKVQPFSDIRPAATFVESSYGLTWFPLEVSWPIIDQTHWWIIVLLKMSTPKTLLWTKVKHLLYFWKLLSNLYWRKFSYHLYIRKDCRIGSNVIRLSGLSQGYFNLFNHFWLCFCGRPALYRSFLYSIMFLKHNFWFNFE